MFLLFQAIPFDAPQGRMGCIPKTLLKVVNVIKSGMHLIYLWPIKYHSLATLVHWRSVTSYCGSVADRELWFTAVIQHQEIVSYHISLVWEKTPNPNHHVVAYPKWNQPKWGSICRLFQNPKETHRNGMLGAGYTERKHFQFWSAVLPVKWTKVQSWTATSISEIRLVWRYELDVRETPKTGT